MSKRINKKQLHGAGVGIFQKIMITFLIAMLPIVIVSALMNSSGKRTVSTEITKSLQSNAHFYLNTFEMEMQRLINMKKQYVLDSTIQDLMQFYMIYSDSEQVQAYQEIERKLQQFKSSSLFVQSIKAIFPKLGMTIYDERIVRSGDLSQADLLLDSHIIKQSNDRLIMKEQYPLREVEDRFVQLYLEITLSQHAMEKSLSDIAAYNNGEAFILQNEGHWTIGAVPGEQLTHQQMMELLDLDTSSASSGIGQFEMGEDIYVYAYEVSELLDATIVVFLSESTFLGPIQRYQFIYYLLIVTAVAVIAFFSTWIYNFIHKPMLTLTGAFRRLEKGDFNIMLPTDQRSDFDYLYRQFNMMSGQLNHLIKEAYEHELRLNRAELKQLQAQMDPHFLYNIFFLMNRMIKLEDMESAKQLTKYLGQFFQYITRNSSDEASLEKEVQHIEAYIGIQRLRFGRKLSVELQPLPEQLKTIVVPRLILQPIVENAFEYGLEDHELQGQLRVSFEIKQAEVHIDIEDNGAEVDDQLLDSLQGKLRASDTKHEATGLLNIHRRLQLKHGTAYGLQVERSSLGGLHVRLTVPLDSNHIS